MPEFPREHSKAALTTGQPRAFRNDADIRTDAADRSNIINKGLEIATDTAMKWKSAVEKIQGDTAKYSYKVGMLEINAGASTDPDINSEAKYQKLRENLRKSVTQGMDQGAIKSISAELDYLDNVGRIGLTTEYQKKTVIAGQAVTKGELDLISKTPTTPENDILRIQDVLGKAKDQYNDVQRQKLEQDYTDRAMQEGFRRDARIDRDLAKKRVEEGYYNFDQKQTDTALSTLVHYKNLEEWEEKQTYTQGAYNIAQGMIDGSLKPEDVTDMYKNREIDLETMTITKEVLTTGDFMIPKDTVLTKPNALLDLLEDSGTNPKEAMGIMKDAIRAFGSNEMGFNQFGYFIKNANEIFEAQKTGDTSFADKLVAGTKQMKNFLKQVPGSEGAELVGAYLKNLADGMEPTEAVLEATRYYIKSRFKPGIYIDTTGNRVKISPDGDTEDVD